MKDNDKPLSVSGSLGAATFGIILGTFLYMVLGATISLLTLRPVRIILTLIIFSAAIGSSVYMFDYQRVELEQVLCNYIKTVFIENKG